MKRNIIIGVCAFALAASFGSGAIYLRGQSAAAHSAVVMVPKFEADPYWPKPMPNHWILGQTIGVSVDSHDNVWVVHRPDSLQEKESLAYEEPGGLLHSGSGCSRVRSGRSPDTALGQGRGARLANSESRHHDR